MVFTHSVTESPGVVKLVPTVLPTVDGRIIIYERVLFRVHKQRLRVASLIATVCTHSQTFIIMILMIIHRAL